MALDMLPSFRWRWERREMNGSHPLIATLAEKVLGVNLRQAGPSSHPVLIPELDWDVDNTSSPVATHTAASTPSLGNTQYGHGPSGTPSFPGSPPIGPAVPAPPRGPSANNSNGGGTSAPAETKLAEIPANLFYPFYPDGPQMQSRSASTLSSTSAAVAAVAAVAASGSTDPNGNGGDYAQLLAQAAAAQQPAPWGASGQESYMLEEKDVAVPMSTAMNMWMPDQRNMRGYAMMGS